MGDGTVLEELGGPGGKMGCEVKVEEELKLGGGEGEIVWVIGT